MPVVAVPRSPRSALAATASRLRTWSPVAYRTGAGARVTVSWLDAVREPPGVEERAAAGRTVLVVVSPSGTAVVAGNAPVTELRVVAAHLE